jgi:uncharacterized protein YeaO (DUF488 family)
LNNLRRLGSILEAGRTGTVTLICAARDPLQNNAIALKQFLEGHLA